MKHNNKKGFTIVELVVVIAIIAILAAVLIPTFASLIKRANVSKDNQLVRNMNTALIADKAINGEHKTMQAAIDVAIEAGYSPARINKSSKENEILWDSVNDVFCYYNVDSKNTNKIDYVPETQLTTPAEQLKTWNYFMIVDVTSADENGVADLTSNKYSVYLRDVASTVTAVKHNKGVDVGENTVNVNYVNDGAAQNVIIRTNGGTLIVNAPNDTVNHYGDAQVITLTAVGNHSYYEHGSVNLVDIKTGRLVITNDTEAEVGTIYLTATNNEYDGIILATQNGSELPEVVARESVDLPTGEAKKLVVTIQTNVDTNGENPTKTEEIYLYPASDVKEATKGYNVSDLGLLVVEAISSEAQEEAADQITDAAVLESVKESNVSTKEEVTAAATEFAGGKGTKANPWLIVDYDTMQAISNHYNDDVQRYFKVKDGITEIDCNEHENGWKSVNIYGYFDGNGVEFKNLDTYLFETAWESKIENFTVKNARVIAGSGAIVLAECHRSTLKDIAVDGGYVEGSSRSAVFVAFGDATEGNVIELINCHSNATVVSCTNTSAAFVGHPYSNNGEFKTTVIIDKCYFNGKILNTETSTPYFVAQSDNTVNVYLRNMDGLESYYAVNNVPGMSKFDAKLTFTDENNETYYRQTNYSVKYTGTHDKILSTTIDCSQEKGQLVSISGTNVSSLASTAKLELMVSPNAASNESGSYTSTYIRENVEVNNGSITASSIFNCDIIINGEITETTGYANNNSSFNVVNNYYGKTHNGAFVKVTQYDSSNNVVGIVNITIANSNAVAVVYNGVRIKSAAAGNSYVYDCGEDLTGKTVTIKIFDRKTSTWTYTYEETELVKTLVQGTDFTVSGSTITINNVEGIKLRNTSLYNYFKEYCRYVITID